MIESTVITRQGGAAKAAHYYAGGADDYYANDGAAMAWQGVGAATLGLDGGVEKEQFSRLLSGDLGNGRHMRRAAGHGADLRKERLGHDLTFSAPKGVSLQALVHGDQRIVDAHNKAVSVAIAEAEKYAMARKTVKGKTSVEHTGNLVVGKFRHETSREQEPDLHTHAIVLNMTQRQDGQWRALTNDALIKSTMQIGQVYRAELARELGELGFTLRHNRDGTFDLAHFTDAQIEAFSTRSQQIEAALDERGLSRDTATRYDTNNAALGTRKPKQQVDRAALHKEWQQRARDTGIDFHSREWAGAGRQHGYEQPLSAAEVADDSVKFAVSSLTEREAIVGRRALVDTALQHGIGRVGVRDIYGAVSRAEKTGLLLREQQLYTSTLDDARHPVALSRDGWIRRVAESGRSADAAAAIVDKGIGGGRLKAREPRYTTPAARERETQILRMERAGRRTLQPSVSAYTANRFLSKQHLGTEQRTAVEMIATSEHRYLGVQGFAGTGKSHMMRAARDLLESEGSHVTTLAPYGTQRKDLQASGLESRTVASFIEAKDKKLDANTVVFLDEAGLVPARQMQTIMETIEDYGARAVLIGDTAQTKAIEAGRPFAQLQDAGMHTAELSDIQRQKEPELAQAVQLAAEGATRESVPHVSRIDEYKDSDARYRALATDYARLPAEERESALIISGTNESRREINALVREHLGLSGVGTTYSMLSRADTTQAERRYSRYYVAGQIIVPERTQSNGLEKGQQYTVLDTGPGNQLTVRGENGATIRFNPKDAHALSVYTHERQELAAGDRIRMTRNDKEGNLANRDQLVVRSIDSGRIFARKADGETVALDASRPVFADLAYASTVHSAQGLTSDRVLMNLETKSRTTSKDVYYVGISRARHEAVLYADDGAKVASAVSRENRKTAALDLVQRHGGHQRQSENQHQRQRNHQHAQERELSI